MARGLAPEGVALTLMNDHQDYPRSGVPPVAASEPRDEDPAPVAPELHVAADRGGQVVGLCPSIRCLTFKSTNLKWESPLLNMGVRPCNEDPDPGEMTEAELVAAATALAGEFRTSEDCVAGGVAAALVSTSGRVYTGVCVDTACGMGFCAEHSAVAEMLKARESAIALVAAVSAASGILVPCGRCRELMWQVDPRNRATRVVVGPGRAVTLAELLPQPTRA